MSIYLPRASAPIRRVSSVCQKELLLKALMEKIPISTPENVFSAVDVSILRLLLSTLKILHHVPQIPSLIAELELIPVTVKRIKPYSRPFCCSLLEYTAVRDHRGAILDVIQINV